LDSPIENNDQQREQPPEQQPELTPVNPEPSALPESPATRAVNAASEWPRQAEPESDEAWEAFGMPRVQTEAPPPVDTIEQRANAKRARRSALLSQVGEELFAWAKTLTSAAVYATLIVTFGFQVARVEGQSMAPTLEDQDRLIVNKLAYLLDSPKVGDVVMLIYPKDPTKSFVKRIVAEPLDTVRIVEGRVYVNDELRPDEFIPDEYRGSDDLATEVVAEGYYFVMGDHRNNSSDSRHWGFVPKKYILGRVQLRWWPFSHARVF
jgi:signal peptidase I